MNTAIDFFSSTVRAYTEDEVEVIGFGDHDEAPDTWIIISRFDDPGADEESRDEMIGIQASTSEYEIDAAIVSILLLRQSIDIGIHDDKADELGAQRLIARFTLDDQAFAHLKKAIESICLGSSILLRIQP